MLRSIKDILQYAASLIDQAVTATVASASVDTADFNALTFLVSVGAFSFSGTNKISLQMQHSDDDSAWSNCADADIYNAEDGANGYAKILDAGGETSNVYPCHYRGNKRYVRMNLVVGGTVSVPACVIAVKGKLERM